MRWDHAVDVIKSWLLFIIPICDNFSSDPWSNRTLSDIKVHDDCYHWLDDLPISGQPERRSVPDGLSRCIIYDTKVKGARILPTPCRPLTVGSLSQWPNEFYYKITSVITNLLISTWWESKIDRQYYLYICSLPYLNRKTTQIFRLHTHAKIKISIIKTTDLKLNNST